jgi:hypothetical protein
MVAVTILLAAAAHVCHVPAAAYRVPDAVISPSKADARALENYTMCVCGPEGANDAPIVPDRHGRYVYDPRWACERYGWNGHRYSKVSPL